MNDPIIKEEFSRLVEVSALGPEGQSITVTADESERVALAKRFGLAALERLEARVTAVPKDGGAAVRIQFTADVIQSCVVTAEPVAVSFEECVDLVYLLENMEGSSVAGGRREVVVHIDDDDSYEPLNGDTIDVGAAVAEHLGLRIDPYPRKPGATHEAAGAGAGKGLKPLAAALAGSRLRR